MEIRKENLSISQPLRERARHSAEVTNDTSANSENVQEKDKQKEPEYIFSKQLDNEAAAYKEGNATFKDDYESLEKAIEIVRALALRLREKINKLKNPTVNIKSDHPIESSGNSRVAAGIKAYHDESSKSEVEALEQQLSEYERQEAELKLNMLNMIIEERKRLDRLT